MANVSFRDLVVEYSSGGYAVRPFNNFNLDLESGEMVLLLGASGSGKSTLLSILGSLLTPTAGSVHVSGTNITALAGTELTQYRQHGVGFIFQGFNLIPSLDARQNVMMPAIAAGVARSEVRARAEELLTTVGLADRMHHKPSAMSGGQQQRVAIARALILEPPLVIADEPTASLDYIQVDAVIRHLRDLASPGRTVVIATHDERLLPLADRLVELTPHAVVSDREPQRSDVAAGEVLFHQGDAGDLVFEVESGNVEIVRALTGGGEETMQIVEPGGYFGELAPLFGLRRAGTARGGPAGAVVTGYSVRDFRSRHGDAFAGGRP